MMQAVATGYSDDAEAMGERHRIRELLESWIVWRDSGDWERFATLWHPYGRMNATWFQANAADFIAGARKAFEANMVGLHLLGGSSIDLNGSRAVAHTRMQINQRGRVHDVEVDVTCVGRFVDALETHDGKWRILLRQPVYELDRMNSVGAEPLPVFDETILRSFPEGYRHLAYLQTHLGFDVSRSLPGTRGPHLAALNNRMTKWLATGDRNDLA